MWTQQLRKLDGSGPVMKHIITHVYHDIIERSYLDEAFRLTDRVGSNSREWFSIGLLCACNRPSVSCLASTISSKLCKVSAARRLNGGGYSSTFGLD